MVGTAARLE
jgi:hypothetical protein